MDDLLGRLGLDTSPSVSAGGARPATWTLSGRLR